MAEQTVFIVDDDEAVRESLAALLGAEGFVPLAFASAEAFLAAEPDQAAGCLIADIHMPGLSGRELQQELRHRDVGLPTIIITGQGDVPKAVAALKAGAADFLEKPYSVEALLKAVREALDREGRMRRRLAAARDVRARLEALSPREREVMDLMVQGHPNKVIGTRLDISTRTVENHRAKVMEKMQCDHLPALIHTILGLG